MSKYLKVKIRYCAFCFLIILPSCKSMMYNDSIISYEFISPKESFIKIIGDFQEVSFIENEWLRVMPAYFREYSKFQNVLIVGVSAKNKFGLDKIIEISSEEFGKLNLETIRDIGNDKQYKYFIYQISLKDIDPEERKNRLLNDVITLKLGDLEYKFATSVK